MPLLLLGRTGLCRGFLLLPPERRGLSVSRGTSARKGTESSRQGLWGLLQKAPLSGSLGGNSFPIQATVVCRLVWDGGLTRETKCFFKTLVIPCIQIPKTVTVLGGVTLVFKHVFFGG